MREKLIFVTSNDYKFNKAKVALDKVKVPFETIDLSIDEIQSDSIEDIVQDKGIRALRILNKPLFVNQSEWRILALNGFPGPYMKYVNRWLSASDILKLMNGHSDRRVILKNVIFFIDDSDRELFVSETVGTIVHHPRGGGFPSDQIISLDQSGLTIGQQYDNDIKAIESSSCYEDFALWVARKPNIIKFPQA